MSETFDNQRNESDIAFMRLLQGIRDKSYLKVADSAEEIAYHANETQEIPKTALQELVEHLGLKVDPSELDFNLDHSQLETDGSGGNEQKLDEKQMQELLDKLKNASGMLEESNKELKQAVEDKKEAADKLEEMADQLEKARKRIEELEQQGQGGGQQEGSSGEQSESSGGIEDAKSDADEGLRPIDYRMRDTLDMLMGDCRNDEGFNFEPGKFKLAFLDFLQLMNSKERLEAKVPDRGMRSFVDILLSRENSAAELEAIARRYDLDNSRYEAMTLVSQKAFTMLKRLFRIARNDIFNQDAEELKQLAEGFVLDVPDFYDTMRQKEMVPIEGFHRFIAWITRALSDHSRKQQEESQKGSKQQSEQESKQEQKDWPPMDLAVYRPIEETTEYRYHEGRKDGQEMHEIDILLSEALLCIAYPGDMMKKHGMNAPEQVTKLVVAVLENIRDLMRHEYDRNNSVSFPASWGLRGFMEIVKQKEQKQHGGTEGQYALIQKIREVLDDRECELDWFSAEEDAEEEVAKIE